MEESLVLLTQTQKDIKLHTMLLKKYGMKNPFRHTTVEVYPSWHYLKKNADRNYRSLNSQLLKIIEDWLVDHDFMDNNDRTKSE